MDLLFGGLTLFQTPGTIELLMGDEGKQSLNIDLLVAGVNIDLSMPHNKYQF